MRLGINVRDIDEIKHVNTGEFFTFKHIENPDSSQVWIKENNSYCRQSKKYIVTNCADHNKTKYVDGSKKIYLNFTY